MSDKPLPIAAAVYPTNPPFDASGETTTYSRSEAHDRLLSLGYTGTVAKRFLSDAIHTLETMEPTSSAAKVLRAYLRDPFTGMPAEERQRICALAIEARDRIYDRDPGTGGPPADTAYHSIICREVAAWRASQLGALPDDERRRIEVAAEQARAATGMRTSAPWAGQHVYEKTLTDGAAAFHASQAAPQPAPEPSAATWMVAQPGPSTVHLNVPYVATLPDGTRVNLPAGTTLREGVDARPNTVEAIGLLRKARVLIGSATGLNVDHTFRALSEVEAFLRRVDSEEIGLAANGSETMATAHRTEVILREMMHAYERAALEFGIGLYRKDEPITKEDDERYEGMLDDAKVLRQELASLIGLGAWDDIWEMWNYSPESHLTADLRDRLEGRRFPSDPPHDQRIPERG